MRSGQACDGVQDCPDASDELGCVDVTDRLYVSHDPPIPLIFRSALNYRSLPQKIFNISGVCLGTVPVGAFLANFPASQRVSAFPLAWSVTACLSAKISQMKLTAMHDDTPGPRVFVQPPSSDVPATTLASPCTCSAMGGPSAGTCQMNTTASRPSNASTPLNASPSS